MVGVVFAAAVGLRVYSHLNRQSETAPEVGGESDIEYRDYVAHPVIAIEEMGKGPKRIISIAPSITETLCALGLRDRLVGRTTFCKHPPGIEEIETVGGVVDTNYQRVIALRPDLIVVTHNSESLIDNLKRLEQPVLPVPHETLENMYTAIEEIGRQCQRPATARALVRLIRSDMDEIHCAAVAKKDPPLRVAITTGVMPVPAQAIFVAGPGSYLDELLQLTGHVNAASDVVDAPFPEVSIEAVLRMDPDVILEFRDRVDDGILDDVYAAWSQVGKLRAIEGRRVRTVGGSEWLSAGPRIATLLHRMAEILSNVR
jgi:iron complex transport system substrate-binding protein